jgi:hypothetical protein
MNTMRLPFNPLIALFLTMVAADPLYANTCVAPPPLKPIRQVCGTVRNQLGELIPNATVTILRGETELFTVPAASDGKFAIEGLSAGSYKLCVHAQGYLDEWASLVIKKPSTKCGKKLEVVLGTMSCVGHVRLR